MKRLYEVINEQTTERLQENDQKIIIIIVIIITIITVYYLIFTAAYAYNLIK